MAEKKSEKKEPLSPAEQDRQRELDHRARYAKAESVVPPAPTLKASD